MKKSLLSLSLGLFSCFQVNTVYALPATLNEVVYIQGFSCGADHCYLDLEIANIDNVTFSTLCNEPKYCRQYFTAYEKIAANASEEDYPIYEINQKARVQMSLVDNENSGQKIYETQKITYLAD